MAEISAKSLVSSDAVVRRCAGAHVELVRTQASLPESGNWFDHRAWSHCEPVDSGRGSNWYVDADGQSFVLRHFLRGGAIARVLGNKYWFGSEQDTRSFAEFNLLLKLRDYGLPVPEPVAAGYDKSGPWYTAQLLTRRIPDAISWSKQLAAGRAVDQPWGLIGRTIARLHAVHVDHADLNAHNILINDGGEVFLIDFDKGMQRADQAGGWREANLMRLRRSLNKLLPAEHAAVDKGWIDLTVAYEDKLRSLVQA